MRFRDFFYNENVGLGNLGVHLDRLFNTDAFRNHSAAFVSNDYDKPNSGMSPDMLQAPISSIEIPQVERTGRIKILEYKKNPIYLELSDGTKAHFSYDEFKRIKGSPAVGKVMTIVFQRHPKDLTNQHSKIDHAYIQEAE